MDPLSIIASTIAVVQATAATYKAIQKLKGLPKEFIEISQRFPLAEDTLCLLRSQLETQTLDEASKTAIEPCITSCEVKAKKLRDIFQSIESGVRKDGSVIEFYRILLLRLGKAQRVETLMNGMLRDLDVITTNRIFSGVAIQGLETRLKQAINQLSTVTSSVPDTGLDNPKSINQTIEFGGTGYLAHSQYNNPGNGQQYNVSGSGHTMNFGPFLRDRKLRILQTLYTTPYRDRMNRNPVRVPGTCEWFINHSNFKQWHTCPSSSMLWVSANPGCGKSVLVKYLVDSVLQTTRLQTICYFFFKDDFADQRTATGALCCILHQIFTKRPDLFSDDIAARFETHQTQLSSSFDELWDALIAVSQCEAAGKIVCLLDAFDECADNERHKLSLALRSFYDPKNISKNYSSLKFLITSRPYNKIGKGFQPLDIPGLPVIHLKAESDRELSKIAQEINIYIAFKVSHMQDLSYEEREILLQKLQSVSNRTYLWVYLAIEWIESEMMINKNQLEEIALTVPQTVDQAYEKILVQSRNPREARKLLHIVVAATQPLTLAEMDLAMALQSPLGHGVDWDLKREERFGNYIRDLCGLFINIIDSKIYLLHQTAKEFLVSTSNLYVQAGDGRYKSLAWKSSLEPAESHSIICRVCIWHLLNPRFSALVLPDHDDEVFDAICSHVFLGYAATNWATHLRESNIKDDASVIESITQICDPRSLLFRTWFRIYWTTTHTGVVPIFNTLTVASYFGLEQIVKLELELDHVDVNYKDGIYQRSPLSWAAENGFDSVVELLIKGPKFRLKRAILKPFTLMGAGATVDGKDINARTPLSYAAWNGHLAVVKRLVNAKAHINAEDNIGGTPLYYALCTGHADVANEMLRGSKADAASDIRKKLLLSAAEAGQEKVVQMLIETGVDIDARNARGQTALYCAIYSEHEAIVRLLLDNGPDIEARAKTGWNSLWLAAQNRQTRIVKLLLDSGADTEVRVGTEGKTPLSWAIDANYSALVNLMLDYNAQVDCVDESGRTPLSSSAWLGRIDTMELLIENGAQIDSRDKNGQTPLWWAAKNGCSNAVQLLLDHKADVQAEDDNGLSPLQCATEAQQHYSAHLMHLHLEQQQQHRQAIPCFR